MRFTECMTGVELHLYLLPHVMSSRSQNCNFAGFCEGDGFFYTAVGDGKTAPKGVTHSGGSEFREAA